MTNSNKRILLIDDEPQGLDVILKSLGYDIELSTNPVEGLKKIFLNLDYDLVVIDLMMPEMSGWQILETLRNSEKTKTLPVIILSALGSTENQASGLNYGADDYIVKPYEIQTLIARIESLLRRVEWDRKSLITLNINSDSNSEEEDKQAHLTNRQREILTLMSQGFSNKEMAKNLFLSETTIKAHLRSIFKKLNVSNRTQAVLMGIRNGLIA